MFGYHVSQDPWGKWTYSLHCDGRFFYSRTGYATRQAAVRAAKKDVKANNETVHTF